MVSIIVTAIVSIVITALMGTVFLVGFITTLILGHIEVMTLKDPTVWLGLGTFAAAFLGSWFRRRPPPTSNTI